MRVLLVEDDGTIGEAVRSHVSADGHAVDWARTLADAEDLGYAVRYGLVLLDLSLPDGSGLVFLRGLRARGDLVPVIALTAKDRFSDRIEGLNAGADDYLVKPFDLGELRARIHAVARRSGPHVAPTLRFGDLAITPAERAVSRDGLSIELTSREWAVLDALLERLGTIVPKTRIEVALYEFGAEIESNAVEVYVSRLRRKLGPSLISTARGLGYRIERPERHAET